MSDDYLDEADPDLHATAYLTYRVDCQACGEVTDLADGEEPPERCDCGALVVKT